jgi:hypothetical protein
MTHDGMDIHMVAPLGVEGRALEILSSSISNHSYHEVLMRCMF